MISAPFVHPVEIIRTVRNITRAIRVAFMAMSNSRDSMTLLEKIFFGCVFRLVRGWLGGGEGRVPLPIRIVSGHDKNRNAKVSVHYQRPGRSPGWCRFRRFRCEQAPLRRCGIVLALPKSFYQSWHASCRSRCNLVKSQPGSFLMPVRAPSSRPMPSVWRCFTAQPQSEARTRTSSTGIATVTLP